MSRSVGTIIERDKFYILTNGEQSEKNYFELIKSQKSIYDVKVRFFNDDPLKLIEHAINFIEEANQVWCVFDIDNSFNEGRLIPAIHLARKHGINYAFSNLAFEVWLISHFEKCENHMDQDKHIKVLDKIVAKILGEGRTYDKSDKELLKKYFIPKVKTAIENSKITHQKRIKAHKEHYGETSNFRIWEWNSCTNVYELIEALELQTKTLL